jgi:hypothetical protein
MSEVPSNQEREGTCKPEHHNLTLLFFCRVFLLCLNLMCFYIGASPWVTIYEIFFTFAGETK